MSRPNYDFIDYYDCSGKTDGNYMHPTDCTRYIVCANGRASDMACPDCDPKAPESAGREYLYFNVITDACDWPLYTEACTEAIVDGIPPTVSGS